MISKSCLPYLERRYLGLRLASKVNQTPSRIAVGVLWRNSEKFRGHKLINARQWRTRRKGLCSLFHHSPELPPSRVDLWSPDGPLVAGKRQNYFGRHLLARIISLCARSKSLICRLQPRWQSARFSIAQVPPFDSGCKCSTVATFPILGIPPKRILFPHSQQLSPSR